MWDKLFGCYDPCGYSTKWCDPKPDPEPVNTPPVAVDDDVTIVAGEMQTVDVLANDTDADDDPLSIVSVGEVTDEDGNVIPGATATIVNGEIKIDTGSIDPGKYCVTYLVTDGSFEAATETRVIDFEEFSAGDVITNQIDGVSIEVSYGGSREAMIFDATNPTGGDHDLGVAEQGNLLIISEDGDSSDPDDEAHGGKVVFSFDEETDIESITLVDVEEGAKIYAYDEDGGWVGSVRVKRGEIDDGEAKVIDLDFEDVATLKVKLYGSGAIDDLVVTEDVEVPVTDEGKINIEVTPPAPMFDTARDTIEILSDVNGANLELGFEAIPGLPFTRIAGILENDAPELDRAVFVDGSLAGVSIAADGTQTVLDNFDFISFSNDATTGDLLLTTTYGNGSGSFDGLDDLRLTFEYIAFDDDTGGQTAPQVVDLLLTNLA